MEMQKLLNANAVFKYNRFILTFFFRKKYYLYNTQGAFDFIRIGTGQECD